MSCGFCIFNNVAVGALHALEGHGLERVAIVDIDVHHGNGELRCKSAFFCIVCLVSLSFYFIFIYFFLFFFLLSLITFSLHWSKRSVLSHTPLGTDWGSNSTIQIIELRGYLKQCGRYCAIFVNRGRKKVCVRCERGKHFNRAEGLLTTSLQPQTRYKWLTASACFAWDLVGSPVVCRSDLMTLGTFCSHLHIRGTPSQDSTAPPPTTPTLEWKRIHFVGKAGTFIVLKTRLDDWVT